jgi:SAM-dependent methyltransferase
MEFAAMPDIGTQQKIEIEYWRDAEHEAPGAEPVYNIVNKITDAAVLIECFARHGARAARADGRVLEIGAGQGWAACLYKRLNPCVHITVTDISPWALQSLPVWERIFDVRADAALACRCYDIPAADSSFDFIFCFASAHHFLAHGRTLRELRRVLRPGGAAVYFYEPASPRLLYGPARRRVNRKRPAVPEDVLIPARLRACAEAAGLNLHVAYNPSLIKRGPLETVYFYLLARIPPLRRLLPCTADFIFTKREA